MREETEPVPVAAEEDKVEDKVEAYLPARGARFRFVGTERTLGEYDDLESVKGWVSKNEVNPTKIEVLNASGEWMNFDTLKI